MKLTRLLAVLLVMMLVVSGAAPAAAKKKKKKVPPPAVCQDFVPGELGSGAPVIKLAPTATEAAPLTQTVTLDPSIANATQGLTDFTYSVFNIQVDPAAADTGLYVRMDFPMQRDYDLWLRHPDGSAGASAHEWNTVFVGSTYPPVLQGNGSHGNESSSTHEAMLGIRTPDCGGWTVEVQNWFGEGGDFDIQLWLGEATIDPLPAGQEPR